MQINITTQYNIGDILYLQQTNGGGLRKVQLVDTFESSLRHRHCYVFNKKVYLAHIAWHNAWEDGVIHSIKYARRGNTWLTEKPPKKRKPITETSNVRWEQAAAKIMSEWGM